MPEPLFGITLTRARGSPEEEVSPTKVTLNSVSPPSNSDVEMDSTAILAYFEVAVEKAVCFVSFSEEDDEVAAATKAISSDATAKELGSTPEEKKVKFNQFLASVKKNKDDKAKIEGILKLAKEKFKFPKTMMDDLKRAAGRDVEV